MKKILTNYSSGLRRPLIALIILMLIIFGHRPALAISLTDTASPVPAAAMKLVGFCADPKAGLDAQAVAILVDYILEPKTNKEAELPKIKETPGAYYEFDTRINFSSFLQYAYNSQVPASLTSPASLRYSLWTGLPGELQKMPASWKLVPPAGKPLIIYGLQRDGITPDLTTGVYYEYDLKKTLIILNHKGRQVFISISKQIDISDIGKKGVILGNDEDWNYFYSGIPGSTKAGLGWVKSYIYDFFSVGIYVESGPMVRSGNFQWIRAGWSGVNFVQTSHIIKGMKRNAKNSKAILESPKLPAPSQIASTYQKLSFLPKNDLVERYTVLQQARKSLAILSGKIDKNEVKKQDSYANTPKEQIVEELMLEYFKITLGKSSLLGQKVVFGN
ncbi:MAG: hypothetical protein WCO53_06390 [Deltaproteobacteria bacterium]